MTPPKVRSGPRRGGLGASLLLALALGAAPAGGVNAAPAAPPVADTTEKAGYWLSVDLIGPAAARADAAHALSEDTSPHSPRDGRLPGEAVGHVRDIHAVLRWLETHAFGPSLAARRDTPQLLEVPAPGVAGALQEEFGVQLRAVVVTGATAAGDRRSIDWPADARRILPPDSRWEAAALLPAAAPLFAAPAPSVPPAAERFAMARRRGDVFVVGTIDRCDAARTCTRWSQVVVRDDDRFIPGYLPAEQVAVREAWLSSTEEHLPRAQLIRAGVHGDVARLVLVARDAQGALHKKTVVFPAVDGGFPEVELRVDGDQATLVHGGETLSIVLDAALDARPPNVEPDAAPDVEPDAAPVAPDTATPDPKASSAPKGGGGSPPSR